MSTETERKNLLWACLPECNALADGWSAKRFTDVCDVVAGQSPPSETYNEKGQGLPFLQGNGDFSVRHPSPKSWCTGPAKVAAINDTLISVRAPVGEVNRADRQYAIGRGLAAIRAISADPDYIYQGLQRWRWSLQRVAQGTTFDAVTARHFSQLLIALPDDIDEQAAIARVLNAVDAVIDQAGEVTFAFERLRRGLMQELLPPWIGFRRADSEALPEGVESIEMAKDVCDVCNGTTPSRTEGRYWRSGSIAWLPTGKVHDRTIRFADQFVTEIALRECSINILPRGTVLVGMIGQGRTRGMAAYLDVEACINQNFGAFVPQGRVSGKWLFHYFDYHYSRLREVGGGTNQGALNCFLLKRLRLPLPSLKKQAEVAAILDSIESLIERNQAKSERLSELKKSLMHDLLTGTVRVDPNLFVKETSA